MKRWYLYVLLGLAFGVIDWFYLDWLAFDFSRSLGEPAIWMIPVMIFMNYGIWLVPLVPAVIFESRKADRIRTPILTGVLIWSSAILSYYLLYWVLLSLGKLPNLEYLRIFGTHPGDFWVDYWRKVKNLILGQTLEWIPIAIIGGAIIGALAWWIFRPRKPVKTDSPIG